MGIKSAQMESDRKTFETWPQFRQNSLWLQNAAALALRELPPAERLAGVRELKEAGNAHFKAKAYAEAVEQYEAAVGSFVYAKQLDPEWRKKGIRDESIEWRDERGGLAAADELVVSCYNNLAACYLARAAAGTPDPGGSVDGDYALCVAACTAAVELQPGCAKALFRRARALTEPLSAGPEQAAAAIRDLTAAAASAPDDREVRKLLTKLKRERAARKAEEKGQFAGLFNKGEIYDADALAREAEEAAKAREASAKSERRTPEECEAEAKEAEKVVAGLREQGRHDDADKLEAKVAEHRRQLGVYEELQREADEKARRNDPRNIDFANPTAEQIADAKKHGIDLADPMVIEELMRLQREKLDGGGGDDDDASGGGASGGGGARRRPGRGRRRRPPPDVSSVPLWEIKRRLDDFGVSYAAIEGDRPALEQLLLEQYTYEEDEYEGTYYEEDQHEGGGDEGGGERRGWAVWLTSWSGTAAITAVLMAARFAPALARYAMSADEESEEYNSAALD